MLRIPGEGDATAPLMVPLQKIGFAEADHSHTETRPRSGRKKRAQEGETPDWEASAGKWRAEGKGKASRTVGVVASWLGMLAAIAAVVIFFVRTSGADPVTAAPGDSQGQEQFDDLVREPLLQDESQEEPVELPKVMKRSEAEFLKEAEPVAKQFMEAETIDGLLPVVRDAKRVEPKIRAYYPDGKIPLIKMQKFNSSGRVSYKDSMAAVSVLTGDYENKQLAFIDGADGLKIDWESWVGWSEMPWDVLMKEKPVEPKLLRVMLRWVDYYNFGFSDENEWRSYRLSSPDGEHMLYGYVARNSLLDQRLRPAEQGATVAATIRVRYRENEQSPQQVVIEEHVADGWVIGEAK